MSDIHSGHKLGLCNPNVELEENQSGEIKKVHPELSEIQKFMYEVYQWGIAETIKLAGKDDIILIHDGDPTHGKAPFLQTMTTRMSDQILIAVANLGDWFQYPNIKTVRFAIGTGIHEMGEGSSSTLVSELLTAKYPAVDFGVVYHGLLNINGFQVDYSHHGPNIGSRKWLEGNELRYYLRSIMISEIMSGHVPPQLVLRGHYHLYKREFLETSADGKFYGSWIVLLPGFTFKDDYTRRVTRS